MTSGTGAPTAVPGITPSYWVTVTVTENIPALFSAVLNQQWMKVASQATAGIIAGTGGVCIFALDPNAPGSLSMNGNTTLKSNCGIYVNSTDAGDFNGRRRLDHDYRTRQDERCRRPAAGACQRLAPCPRGHIAMKSCREDRALSFLPREPTFYRTAYRWLGRRARQPAAPTRGFSFGNPPATHPATIVGGATQGLAGLVYMSTAQLAYTGNSSSEHHHARSQYPHHGRYYYDQQSSHHSLAEFGGPPAFSRFSERAHAALGHHTSI
jgi:hypothetical protein